MSNFIRNDRLMNGFAASSSTVTAKSGSATITINSSTIATLAEEYDTHGAFALATGVFTPTVAGYYLFQCAIWAGSLATGGIGYLRKNGTAIVTDSVPVLGTACTPKPGAIIYMNGSTDYVDFLFNPNGDTSYNMNAVRIEGVLVGL